MIMLHAQKQRRIIIRLHARHRTLS